MEAFEGIGHEGDEGRRSTTGGEPGAGVVDAGATGPGAMDALGHDFVRGVMVRLAAREARSARLRAERVVELAAARGAGASDGDAPTGARRDVDDGVEGDRVEGVDDQGRGSEAVPEPDPRVGFEDFVRDGGFALFDPRVFERRGGGVALDPGEVAAAFAKVVEERETAPSTFDEYDAVVVRGEGVVAAIVAAAADGAVHLVEHDEMNWVVFADMVVATDPSWGAHRDPDADLTVAPYVATWDGAWDATEVDMINASDDPYFGDEENRSFDVVGDDEEFGRLLRDVLLTSDGHAATTGGERAVVIRVWAASQDEGARVECLADLDDGEALLGIGPREDDLFECVLANFEPRGYTWEYNDGAHDRMSGYYQSQDTIEIEVEPVEPSAVLRAARAGSRERLRVEAAVRLVAWLEGSGAPDDLVAGERARLEALREGARAVGARGRAPGRAVASGTLEATRGGGS